jgi:chemotaxis protein MotB
MSASHGRRGGRRRGGHDAAHENDERWLLTYADMITLLMALFMVLFSISSVNISKYQVLQKSLKAAFSGSILPGGRSILQAGSTSTSKKSPATADVPSIVPLNPTTGQQLSGLSTAAELKLIRNSIAAANAQTQDFQRLKQQLDTYAAAHGFAGQVQTIIERRGLVVRVLTDNLLFDSGQATLQPAGMPLMTEIASLLNVDTQFPIVVEGHTDNVPIASAQFPSNWELSTARAITVTRYLIAHGVNRNRLAAAGYADTHPVAENATATGRALNRRVEIVVQRLDTATPGIS